MHRIKLITTSERSSACQRDRGVTSVTHLEQAISLETYKDMSRLIGSSAIFFFAFVRIYIIALDRKYLTLNIVTRYIWVDILC